jgi:hypothetical protein
VVRQHLIVVLHILDERHAELLDVAQARRPARLVASLGKDGEEDRGQDGDDR